MKKLILTIAINLVAIISFAQVNSNSTYVNGYYRSNGTYVQGYYRTAPNNTNRDNYSTSPNTNPYTGERGTVTPDNNYNNTYPNPNNYNYNNSNNYSNKDEDE